MPNLLDVLSNPLFVPALLTFAGVVITASFNLFAALMRAKTDIRIAEMSHQKAENTPAKNIPGKHSARKPG